MDEDRKQQEREDGFPSGREKPVSEAGGHAGKIHDGHGQELRGSLMSGHDMAGMDHMEHMDHMGNLKLKFWVCLVVSVPILLLSPMMGIHFPFRIVFAGSD